MSIPIELSDNLASSRYLEVGEACVGYLKAKDKRFSYLVRLAIQRIIEKCDEESLLLLFSLSLYLRSHSNALSTVDNLFVLGELGDIYDEMHNSEEFTAKFCVEPLAGDDVMQKKIALDLWDLSLKGLRLFLLFSLEHKKRATVLKPKKISKPSKSTSSSVSLVDRTCAELEDVRRSIHSIVSLNAQHGNIAAKYMALYNIDSTDEEESTLIEELWRFLYPENHTLIFMDDLKIQKNQVQLRNKFISAATAWFLPKYPFLTWKDFQEEKKSKLSQAKARLELVDELNILRFLLYILQRNAEMAIQLLYYFAILGKTEDFDANSVALLASHNYDAGVTTSILSTYAAVGLKDRVSDVYSTFLARNGPLKLDFLGSEVAAEVLHSIVSKIEEMMLERKEFKLPELLLDSLVQSLSEDSGLLWKVLSLRGVLFSLDGNHKMAGVTILRSFDRNSEKVVEELRASPWTEKLVNSLLIFFSSAPKTDMHGNLGILRLILNIDPSNEMAHGYLAQITSNRGMPVPVPEVVASDFQHHNIESPSYRKISKRIVHIESGEEARAKSLGDETAATAEEGDKDRDDVDEALPAQRNIDLKDHGIEIRGVLGQVGPSFVGTSDVETNANGHVEAIAIDSAPASDEGAGERAAETIVKKIVEPAPASLAPEPETTHSLEASSPLPDVESKSIVDDTPMKAPPPAAEPSPKSISPIQSAVATSSVQPQEPPSPPPVITILSEDDEKKERGELDFGDSVYIDEEEELNLEQYVGEVDHVTEKESIDIPRRSSGWPVATSVELSPINLSTSSTDDTTSLSSDEDDEADIVHADNLIPAKEVAVAPAEALPEPDAEAEHSAKEYSGDIVPIFLEIVDENPTHLSLAYLNSKGLSTQEHLAEFVGCVCRLAEELIKGITSSDACTVDVAQKLLSFSLRELSPGLLESSDLRVDLIIILLGKILLLGFRYEDFYENLTNFEMISGNDVAEYHRLRVTHCMQNHLIGFATSSIVALHGRDRDIFDTFIGEAEKSGAAFKMTESLIKSFANHYSMGNYDKADEVFSVFLDICEYLGVSSADENGAAVFKSFFAARFYFGRSLRKPGISGEEEAGRIALRIANFLAAEAFKAHGSGQYVTCIMICDTIDYLGVITKANIPQLRADAASKLARCSIL